MKGEAQPDDTGILISTHGKRVHLWPLTPEVLMGLDAYRDGLTYTGLCEQYRLRLTEGADGSLTICIERKRPIAKD